MLQQLIASSDSELSRKDPDEVLPSQNIKDKAMKFSRVEAIACAARELV
jgi:hypothetical protein